MSGSHRANSSDETPRIEAGPKGSQIWWRGRRLLGPSPRDSQLRRLPAQPHDQTLYVCISPLLGEGLSPFVRRLSRNSAVLCVELEPCLAELWHRRESGLSMVPLVSSWVDVTSVAQTMISQRAIRRVETVTLSGGGALYRERYRHIEPALQTVIQRFWANRGTEIRLGRRWLANVWKNTGQASGDLAVLSDAMPPKAVLIGAGPSLDADIALLEETLLRESTETFTGDSEGGTGDIRRPAIVAIDTALPALAARQIPVDCVVAMDGQLANAADLVPWVWHNSVLIADISTHPSIVRTFDPARRAFFATRFSDLRLFPSSDTAGTDTAWTDSIHGLTAKVPSLVPRGSVAPSALEILVYTLGVTDLVILGIDFWYHPPRTHARMATGHRRFLNLHNRISGTGGAAQLVQRPWRSGTLRNGEPVQLDGILADQAAQMAHVVSVLQGEVPDVRFRQLPNRGLPIGTDEISPGELKHWVTTTPSWRLPRTIATDRSRMSYERRLAALNVLGERLIAQEAALTADGPVFLDAMLDFAWFDLPQWPLAGRTAAAARLHRLRFLRAVRDHRRRVIRALAAAGVTPRESP
ncbi:MAG: DUF115 domain-containing protein [Spirochaeta sp.]|jgi:hypothetical protein|nr:DUF115 domain-containing protein [Spirochaeta sp.]